MKSLRREFDLFRKATKRVPACAHEFWGKHAPRSSGTGAPASPSSSEESGEESDGAVETAGDALISFDDWLQVDNWYRSRALEFPGIGDATVPCIDMANHASGEATGALYECDSNGDAVLLLRDGKSFVQDDEITITYGDAKGACEMLFSYGFLESGMEDAREMFLSFDLPEDDPLARAKKHIAKTPPGFKIFHSAKDDSKIDWHGPFLYLSIVNEEDGLDFRVLQSTDGERELKAFFKEDEITGGEEQLLSMLEKEDLWDVFQLRAVCLLQARVLQQIQTLEQSADDLEKEFQDVVVAETPDVQAVRLLRRLERKLLDKAEQEFESTVGFQ